MMVVMPVMAEALHLHLKLREDGIACQISFSGRLRNAADSGAGRVLLRNSALVETDSGPEHAGKENKNQSCGCDPTGAARDGFRDLNARVG